MAKEIRKEMKTFYTQTMDGCRYSATERLAGRRAREIVMKSNEIIT